ncbi:MAG: response regulator [Bacilli bacterium]|nr:response regulator [Bacilli bacterium]
MKDISFLEKNGVDIKQSLEIFGDANTYNETIGEFLVGIHTKINQLIEMMNNSDMNNYAIIVHSLKSDAKYFGFMALADMAYEHEMKSKAGDVYFVTNHINDLINETNKAIVLIQEYMNSDETVTNANNDTGGSSEVKGEVYTSKTILVVDDSNIIRNFVKRIFSDDYNVGTAKDGEEAIGIIKANQDNNFIEIVLLDLNMPKVDGFAVLEYMRQNDLLRKMPVSIISGDSSKETIDRAFTYDIVDMLEKPFTEQNIKTVIEKTIVYKGME